jgi:hypothetical protein
MAFTEFRPIIRRGVIFWTTVSRSTCCQAQVSKMLTIAVFFFSHWATAAEKGDDRVSDTHADSHENISHSGSSGFVGNTCSAETAPLVAVYGALAFSAGGGGGQCT